MHLCRLVTGLDRHLTAHQSPTGQRHLPQCVLATSQHATAQLPDTSDRASTENTFRNRKATRQVHATSTNHHDNPAELFVSETRRCSDRKFLRETYCRLRAQGFDELSDNACGLIQARQCRW